MNHRTVVVAMPRYVEGNHKNNKPPGAQSAQHHQPPTSASGASASSWQHTDRILVEEGIVFNVRYIGCLEIRASMKMLDFNTRSQVAKECINRVCEAANLITPKKRRVDKRIAECMCEQPVMQHTGIDVQLTVCSKFLRLDNMDTGELLWKHEMPRISFASGGDPDTLDFVAFVAKLPDEWRACYVLECGGGLAKTLISTIGQAFDLRYNEYFVKAQESENSMHHQFGGGGAGGGVGTDKEYYNDLPDKLPPDMLMFGEHGAIPKAMTLPANPKRARDRLSSNLIDLNSPPHDHDYVNDQQLDAALASGAGGAGGKGATNGGGSSSSQAAAAAVASTSPRDVFDMQPFTNTFNSLTAEVQRSQLLTECWFHGLISRPVAESLLQHDGEFLVRERKAKPGQYVLTGMQETTPKHLLLIDPAGVVRTKDRFFDSISHLINYHWNNELPIISDESSLVLRHPVRRPKDQRPAA